ncbi:MAG: ATP-grasp domain-containing protein [Hyphomicrobiales bacterium]|nr:ATP-grasp domain-containing protein [Hyphomicrobiales bacterium]
MTRIHSVLIANRGEIAVRIIRTAKRMGLRTIAVYSDFDKQARHVKLADEAVLIGRSPATDSYLSIERIIEAAIKYNADAIHPGYGFLSENCEFARACEDPGLVFIGPTPGSMELMGDKAAAKKQMLECGISCIDGYQGDDQSDAAFVQAGQNIGYPLMVKAAAGGGGRGMRLVDKPENLLTALEEARLEAQSSFGSGKLILEKAIINARHIEFQVLGDNHGHLIHLGERDCSLQRRHQKVIEEAPSPAIDAQLREKMGKIAVKAAKSVSYRGAGTIEFLLDDKQNFYFLEMNTRLQVEHPVTELVSGLDLVEWQIRIASGEHLDFRQKDIKISGHAIEARIYAEDPTKGFMPSTGKVVYWSEPEGEGIRVDSAIISGDEIGPHYDAMVAKVIVHSDGNRPVETGERNETGARSMARTGLIRALEGTVLFGPQHNKQFLLELVASSVFSKGEANISFIADTAAGNNYADNTVTPQIACFAAVLDFIDKRNRASTSSIPIHKTLLNWSSSPLPGVRFHYRIGNNDFDILVRTKGDDRYEAIWGDENVQISISNSVGCVDGVDFVANAFMHVGDHIYLATGGREYQFHEITTTTDQGMEKNDGGIVLSTMHGTLVEVIAYPGLQVEADTKLAVVEAMKMRHEIFAGVAGIVKSVLKKPASQVGPGDILFEIELESRNDAAGE